MARLTVALVRVEQGSPVRGMGSFPAADLYRTVYWWGPFDERCCGCSHSLK
ncbi:hypothetical protein [Streptomyces sp. IBSBF 2806]|uniref:hypothetical protein n=1 Tax=Streptomyces sp. IBSBF 2806 TaxID=2903529 RepID=UPI002FDBDDFF